MVESEPIVGTPGARSAIARSPIARSPIAPAEPEVVGAGWAVSGRCSDAALRITDCTPLTKVAVKAAVNGTMAELLGVRFGRSARKGWPVPETGGPEAGGPEAGGPEAGGPEAGVPETRIPEVGSADAELPVLVVGAGPGEWLVLAPPGTQKHLCVALGEAATKADELASVVDLTHGRALLRVAGSASRELLAMECGVDLADAMCPDGAALRSTVAGVATDLVRDDLPADDGGSTRSYVLHCERSSGQYLFDSLCDAGAEFGLDVDGFRAPGIQQPHKENRS